MKRIALASLLLLLTLPAPTWAQDAEGGTPDAEDVPEEGAPGEGTPDAEEIPPPPAEETAGSRGLVLGTGETLQGDLVQIKDGTVKFTSDQLGEQELPLDSVESLSTDKPHKVVMPGGGTVEGTVQIANGQVTVTPADGSDAQTFAIADLGAVNPDPEKTELDYWTVTATLGATATYGNTRTRTLFALASVTREDDTTKARMAYTGIYGTDNQTIGAGSTRERAGENAKSHRGDFQFDYKITERLYATPVVGHLLYDKFQNIELRGTVGSGVGYRIFIKDHLKWHVEAGFAYTEVRLRRTPPADLPDRNEVTYQTAARLASGFYYKASDRVTFEATWESYIGTKDIEDTFHRGTASVAYKLFGGVALGIGAIYDRIENPSRTSAGRRARRDDLKVTLTLSMTF